MPLLAPLVAFVAARTKHDRVGTPLLLQRANISSTARPATRGIAVTREQHRAGVFTFRGVLQRARLFPEESRTSARLGATASRRNRCGGTWLFVGLSRRADCAVRNARSPPRELPSLS